MGSFASLVIVNSTWTYNHIRSLWKYVAWRKRIKIVYPPCLVADLQAFDLRQEAREPVILSIGQFRPEKDHELQIEALACLFRDHPELQRSKSPQQVKLVLIGSCRGESDKQRLQVLKELTNKLNLADYVEFVVNQPYSTVQDWLKRASIGIHTVCIFFV